MTEKTKPKETRLSRERRMHLKIIHIGADLWSAGFSSEDHRCHAFGTTEAEAKDNLLIELAKRLRGAEAEADWLEAVRNSLICEYG